MVGTVVELEKIDHVSVGQPVVKVPQCAPEDTTQGDLKHSIACRTSNAIDDNDDGCDGRKDRKQNSLTRRTDGREDSKGHAGVSNIRNVKKSVYYRDRFIKRESGLNQGLSPSIQQQSRDDQ